MIKQQKKVKIFAFPFAGGSKYSYRVLHDYVPADFEWETIELPGRGSRMNEPLLSDIKETAEDVFQQIREKVSEGGEYIIYGHSMGALLGYELTKKIVEAELNKPLCLFLTGRGAPSVGKEKKISDYSRDAFWKEIHDLGGLPKEILGNEEMKDFFEPFLRCDFKAVENYQYESLEKPFPIPLFIRTGSDELIYVKDVRKWQEETEYPLDLKVMPGDHFFIFQHPEYIIMQIVEACKKARTVGVKEIETSIARAV